MTTVPLIIRDHLVLGKRILCAVIRFSIMLVIRVNQFHCRHSGGAAVPAVVVVVVEDFAVAG